MTATTVLRKEIESRAKKAVAAATVTLQKEFKAAPPGSVKLGAGAGGRIPYDTGRLQKEFKLEESSLSSPVLSITLADTAMSDGGFEYPEFLNSGRIGSRSKSKLGGVSGAIHSGWWTDWWADGDGGNRWNRVIAAAWGKAG
jgi:hypothetical protein